MAAEMIRVKNWTEAGVELERVTEGKGYTAGAGYDYPQPFAVFCKDALSGDGMGYRVWNTEDYRVKALVAIINIEREG